MDVDGGGALRGGNDEVAILLRTVLRTACQSRLLREVDVPDVARICVLQVACFQYTVYYLEILTGRREATPSSKP